VKSSRIFIIGRSLIHFLWLIVLTVGPVALHELVDCSHGGMAETLDHQESNHSHWAALRSIDLPETLCQVCTSFANYQFNQITRVSRFFLVFSENQSPADQHFNFMLVSFSEPPRAPPVS
jgi:hypothetical protein